jgi:hypothetical protein
VPFMDERRDAAELAEQLSAVLGSIEAGELTCSAATRHRIEGAVLALSTWRAIRRRKP